MLVAEDIQFADNNISVVIEELPAEFVSVTYEDEEVTCQLDDVSEEKL